MAACLAAFLPVAGLAAPDTTVASPNGLVEFRLLGGGERLQLAVMFRDQPDAPSGVNVEERTARRGDSLSLDLPAGWGFIGRFEWL